MCGKHCVETLMRGCFMLVASIIRRKNTFNRDSTMLTIAILESQ